MNGVVEVVVEENLEGCSGSEFAEGRFVDLREKVGFCTPAFSRGRNARNCLLSGRLRIKRILLYGKMNNLDVVRSSIKWEG